MRVILAILFFLSLFALRVQAGRYDGLASWATHDCNNFAQFVRDLDKAQSARDVSLALQESARRQRKTMDELIRLVHAHPDLREAAQLGLDDEGHKIWEKQRRDPQTGLSTEDVAIQQQMHRRNEAVDAKGGEEMVSVLRKYHDDPQVISASKELRRTIAENRRRLLEAMQ